MHFEVRGRALLGVVEPADKHWSQRGQQAAKLRLADKARLRRMAYAPGIGAIRVVDAQWREVERVPTYGEIRGKAVAAGLLSG